ncbi:MAG: hypothetical protein K2X08_05880 [Chlamydiales bacterium]|nr:hypothetical protein [Chlamydiales bacterium]
MKYSNIHLFRKDLEAAAPHALSRVYLIAVPDDFERKRWLDAVASLVLSPDQPLVRWSAADASLSELFTEIDSFSLFTPNPVTLIDEVEKLSKKQAQGFIDLLQIDLRGHLLLGARSKSSLYSAVEKRGVILDLCDEKPWEKEKRLTDQILDKVRQSGKRLTSEAFQILSQGMDKDAALLEQEINKLLCFTAERNVIESSDVLQVSVLSRSQTVWQMAEEMVWEGRFFSSIDEESFYGLLPALRYQLQTGLKIICFAESGFNSSEMSKRLPKIWPKVLEKRISQAVRLGASYFQKGLELLFRFELLSRSGSMNPAVLFDWFRVSFIKAGKWAV